MQSGWGKSYRRHWECIFQLCHSLFSPSLATHTYFHTHTHTHTHSFMQVIVNDKQFERELKQSGETLVVASFTVDG